MHRTLIGRSADAGTFRAPHVGNVAPIAGDVEIV
jgi:hypothetical protein